MFKDFTQSIHINVLALRVGIICAIFTAVLISMGSMPAIADITRGCEGVFRLEILDPPFTSTAVLDSFEGRGSCKNKLYANKCRERAKDNIIRCTNDLWAARWNQIGNPNDSHADHGRPASCKGQSTGVRNLAFKKNPYGRDSDIKYAMEYTACCTYMPNSNNLTLRLLVSSIGDKKCGSSYNDLFGHYRSTWTVINDYKANCQSLKAKGLCAPRRSGG